MFSILISFGHAASHSPMFVQFPKSSSLYRATIRNARLDRSAWPCGSKPRCEIFAPVNNAADAFGQAATQAPHPMHAAASIARSALSLGTGIAFPSGALPVCAVM
jgi:hypothetical protein